jgi:hypothetical protein
MSKTGFPPKVWKGAIFPFLIGAVLVALPYIVCFPESPGWKDCRDITRDIGIAFVVAATIYVIYEWNTRSGEKKEMLTSFLETAMSSFVPKQLWDEVNKEVLHRMAIRTNLRIELKLLNSATIKGKVVTPLANQKILWAKIKYDLYGLSTGDHRVEVTHYLDGHMKNESIGLPSFEKITVTEFGARPRTDISLDEVFNRDKGCIFLSGKHSVRLHQLDENKLKPATIEMERYEIVSTPGMYTLVMPEMVLPIGGSAVAGGSPVAGGGSAIGGGPVAGAGSADNPVIRVDFLEIEPADFDISVFTWFKAPDREFRLVPRQEGDNWTQRWEFRGVLLPGQGFSITFRVRKGGA